MEYFEYETVHGRLGCLFDGISLWREYGALLGYLVRDLVGYYKGSKYGNFDGGIDRKGKM